HALSLALLSNLRPGDSILSVSGRPYDTLEEVIGIRDSRGSLKEYGIDYDEVLLKPDGGFDLEEIGRKIKKETKLIAIQRSKGYSDRRSFSVEQIGECIDHIRSLRDDLIIMVDNCYGEFVEDTEPTDVGADMAVGSLIKNPGGGLAPTGGYIAGKAECIENAARRLTCPGLGREVGASLGIMRDFYQGLFLAPTVTASALKGAVFAAGLYESLGFDVLPDGKEERYDIIQAVTFHREDALVAFCRGIQAASPVDSFVVPEPWDMPGYDSKVIMASGSFISGSSIELSADGPLREPYSVYFQGGLTWPHAKFGIMNSLQFLVRDGIIDRSKLR
ncbi:MAG: methionine gamma-lyase family protein, partial [Lachnospiraceae bacterium]|nr:methionine gamma-lyase family protein [Lachnospiraceae bacterium]